MKLYLIRHSKPAIEEGLCYGSSDIPLLESDYSATLQRLITILPEKIPIFSSPLQRCAKLASALATGLDCGEPIFDARLAEMNFGGWELQSWESIAHCEIDAWANDLAHYRPGGGENVVEVAERVAAFYGDLIRMHNEAAVICHAGTIRMLLACEQGFSAAGMALQAASTENKIAYGEVITVDTCTQSIDHSVR